MNKKLTFLATIILGFFTAFPGVFAAEIGISAFERYVTGDYGGVVVPLFLDTEGEVINAVQGRVVFPAEILEAEKFGDGESVVNFWVDRPVARLDGEIVFSGIMPGGYSGQGEIFKIFFRRKKPGPALIRTADVVFLKNDGLGTAVEVGDLSFKIGSDPSKERSRRTDTTAPESFSPIVLPREKVFAENDIALFSTQDKGSGIDYYAVKEIKYPLLSAFYPWKVADSPYAITKDHSLIMIKAVDGEGNERIEKIYPDSAGDGDDRYAIMAIIVFLALLAFAGVSAMSKKK